MTKLPEEPTKKIVSKGKYAQVQGQRGGLMLLALSSFVTAGISVCIALLMLVMIIYQICTGTGGGVAGNIPAMIFTATVGAITFVFAKVCHLAVLEAQKMDNVVPLTRVTAPYLPAQESLVRASEPPPIAPQTVLLRPVADTSATPPEQLVRPSATPD